MIKQTIRNNRLVFAVYLGLFVALVIVLVVFQPLRDPVGLTNPPDEPARYLVPQWICEHGTLPTGLEEELRIPGYGFSYGLYNILPYMVMGYFMRFVRLFTASEKVLLLAARFINLLSGLCMACIVWQIGKRLFRQNHWRWLFCFAVMYEPEALFVHSFVNTDSFCLLSSSLIILALIMIRQDGISLRSALLLSTGIIICALSYYNGYGLILTAILLFPVLLVRKADARQWGALLKWGAFVSAIVLAGTAWWFIRAFRLLDGDFLGLRTRNELAIRYGAASVSPENSYAARGLSIWKMLSETEFVPVLIISLIALYGSMKISGGHLFCILYLTLCLAGIVGCATVFLRTLRFRPNWRRWYFHACMAVCIVTPLIILLRYSWTTDLQYQGRYLLPAIIPVVAYLVKGLRELAQRISLRKNGKVWVFPAMAAAYVLVIGGAVYQVLIVSLPAFLQARL